jgi:hypothetical protein
MTETFYQERDKRIHEKYEILQAERPGVKLKRLKEQLSEEFFISMAQLEKILYKKDK